MMVVSVGNGSERHGSPDFDTKQLSSEAVHAANADTLPGAEVFHSKGWEYCHAIFGDGGYRGPELTSAADQLTDQ
jgi:hypothetical protein